MTVDVRIEKLKPRHVEEMAEIMRSADRRELLAASGIAPGAALAISARRSDAAWAGFGDGHLAVVWGAGRASPLSDVGVPWLVSAPLLERHSVAFLRRCRGYVDRIALAYPGGARNWVDARNTAAIRWLGWLGFTVAAAPEPFGPFALPFHRFDLAGKG